MEDAYIINGGKKLKGEVKLSGAKNVALKTIIGALLFNGKVILRNIPRINDVTELIHMINLLGGKAGFIDKNTVVVNGFSLTKNKVDLLHGSKIRVSFMFFAPLLYKFKECFIPNPGGCRIGARPIDRIIDGMTKLGIKVINDNKIGYYKASIKKEVNGSYEFKKVSHTGTELLILLSIFCKNQVEIKNAALEPEIDDLIKFLNEGGAMIKRDGNKITIKGVKELIQKKPFTIVSDRNEAVTYIIMSLVTKGEIIISPICKKINEIFFKKLKDSGCGIEYLGNDRWRFYYYQEIKPVNIETAPYPGFMTDWQPNWAVLMTQANGKSVIKERIFENRFAYVEELKRLGAIINFKKIIVPDPYNYFHFSYKPENANNQAIRIIGLSALHGAVLHISDLRAGATLVVAALVAKGESVIYGVSILERGYEDLVKKVRSLEGDIKKV